MFYNIIYGTLFITFIVIVYLMFAGYFIDLPWWTRAS